MKQNIQGFSAITAFLAVLAIAAPASAQQSGGILKLYSPINPGNLSLLEEPTIGAEMPMMGVFNNLVMFDQHKKQVSLETIVPDLATSWEWSEDGTELTFQLRHGVKWHDSKPFTAQDVKWASLKVRASGPFKR